MGVLSITAFSYVFFSNLDNIWKFGPGQLIILVYVPVSAIKMFY